jgi:adenosine deaminase
MDIIKKLPKVDLHLHLDGSMSVDTILQLALIENIDLSRYSREEIMQMSQVGNDCCSLDDYLTRFAFTTRFLQSAKSIEIAAYEIIKQASEHNCKYVEVRFAPALHQQKGLSLEEVIHHVIIGLKKGEFEFGVKSQGIVICLRNHDEKLNMEVVKAASGFHERGIAAVDSAGPENDLNLSKSIFKYAHKLGMPCTIHAGEAADPQNILIAIEKLGATRIGHGVRLYQNPEIYEKVRKMGIPLEMCPTSNIQTKAISGWEHYPIRQYIEDGISVTINTDNPGVSGTNITKEYEILVDKFSLTIPEIKQIIMNGVDSAFLSAYDKVLLKREIERQ